MVSKEILTQYADMQEEIEKIKSDIKATEAAIARLIDEGTVTDKVMGGYGGIQGFKIEGFPAKEYDRRRKLLQNKYDRLKKRENDLLEISGEVEKFIETIPVSRDRNIFRKIYIEKKTQKEVAREIHVERSLISKIINKYV